MTAVSCQQDARQEQYYTLMYKWASTHSKYLKCYSFELELVDETEEMNTHCCGGTVRVALIHAELCRICYADIFHPLQCANKDILSLRNLIHSQLNVCLANVYI